MKKLKLYSAENSPQAWLYLLPALIIIIDISCISINKNFYYIF